MFTQELAHFNRAQLARLGREYMVAAQFNSRTGYAALRMNHGDEAYLDIAIANWMAASPIYTQRMQKAMGFAGGDDVATIFKGLQLECGFAHQYFDVHFEVTAPDKGRFWLKSCGPLLETEPRGDAAVKVMCHDIEDPTFDATAIATNPRARMRPVHRPPRLSGSCGNHCEWDVMIDHAAEPLTEPSVTSDLRNSLIATLPILRPQQDLEPGGMPFYSGPVVEQLQLEQLSHAALVVVCKELAVQNQLLIRGLFAAVEKRYGFDAAVAVTEFQMIGSAWVISNRLCRLLQCTDGGVDAIVQVLSVHPAFQPLEYQHIRVTKIDALSATLELLDGPALQEQAPASWVALLQQGKCCGLEALLQGIDGRARCRRSDDKKLRWIITVDPGEEPVAEPLAVKIAQGTALYQVKLNDHVQLLQLKS